MGYKAGSTHIVKTIERREGKKLVKRDIVHPATVIECPPMKVVGMVGYVETPRGLRALSTVYAQQLDDDVKRRFYKNWNIVQKKAFTKYADKYKDGAKKSVKRDLERIKKYCSVVRVLCATGVAKLNLRQKKAHVFEVQVNGGTVAQKVAWAQGKFEQEIKVSEVFEENEVTDIVGVTRGHGTQGVVARFKVKRLQHKTHRGIRKVGCIGAWHPAAVKWTVARRGQQGYHSRTELNKKIFKIGAGSIYGVKNNATTEADAVIKNITPLGGFPHYGEVKYDYVLVKGGVAGTKKRPVTLRKSLFPTTKAWMTEKCEIKFIDTASKMGHGRFQTKEEKEKVYKKLQE